MEQMSNLLMAFYGDDFTGSTDSMEALTISGVKTVLFLEVPSKELLQDRFPHIQAFGIPGVSRTMSPKEMDEELKPILKQLQAFNAPIIHYKVCSTFDSSPDVGSIGKVSEIGSELFSHQSAVPLLVGCPILKRYTVFGNHFATVGEETYRLDRHPTMSKHPTTPMNEADLRKHLSKQTSNSADLVSVLDLEQEDERLQVIYSKKIENSDMVIFDILQESHLNKIGKLLWKQASTNTQFVIGSSGVQYALAKYWQQQEIVYSVPTIEQTASPANQLLVVSGSCSPITKAQIEWSLENGFTGIKIVTEELVNPQKQKNEFDSALKQAMEFIKKGESVIIYTSVGPDDPSIEKTKDYLLSLGKNPANTGKIIGEQLGKLTKEILILTGLKRAVIAGGDTSGYATKELGVYALEMIMPVSPGGPLCKCYSENPQFDGLEIALKGGQVGKADYFELVRRGFDLIRH